jgi:hypothetical protein
MSCRELEGCHGGVLVVMDVGEYVIAGSRWRNELMVVAVVVDALRIGIGEVGMRNGFVDLNCR